MRNLERKYGYIEYFENDNHIKKLYNMYINKHVADKVLNILVLLAIVSTITAVILEFLGDVNHTVVIFVHSFAIFILSIFALELLRDYAQSKTKREFFKQHWLDFILVMFLSVYFFFVTFLGFMKFFMFDLLKPLISDLKEARLFYKIFRKE